MARGTLFLVVGPSGAGKDSVIRGARAKLEPAGRHVFPRRVITRQGADASEDYISEDAQTFERCERAGEFALSWRAHDLAYGVPRSIEDRLAEGTHVVVNVSRAIVEAARAKYAPVCVVLVTAPPDVLAARLKARGRESEAQVKSRLSRTRELAADVTIVNDGPLQTAVNAFVAALDR